jgi:hypothetical protein
VCLAGARVDLDRTDSRVEDSWHALEQSHWRGSMTSQGSKEGEGWQQRGERDVAGRARAREVVYRSKCRMWAAMGILVTGDI